MRLVSNRVRKSAKPTAAVVRRKPGRPAAATLDQTRQALHQAALDEFLLKGFEGASINAISRRSGISRDTIYRQYLAKEHLFRAATGYGLARLTEHLTVAVSTSGSVEQVLLRAVLEINSDMSSPEAVPVLRLIIAEAHRFPDVGRQMFNDSRTSLAPLIEYLEKQRTAGVLVFENGFDVAYMLSTLAFGGVRVFLEPEPFVQEEKMRWAAQVVKHFLNGCRAVATPRRRDARALGHVR